MSCIYVSATSDEEEATVCAERSCNLRIEHEFDWGTRASSGDNCNLMDYVSLAPGAAVVKETKQ